MVVDAPTPVPWRPSEREREQVVGSLRDGTVSGRISPDTFSRRVERALGASSRRELEDLVADLPPRRRFERFLHGALGLTSTTLAGLRATWQEPNVERLELPRPGVDMTLGRSGSCDCLVPDETVSRRHACIRRAGERWLLRDLSSLNGTRVNGSRVAGEVEVRPGDRLSLGLARFRLTAPR
jgi:FHA domain/Domain of unknown function (DUF1707)